MKFFNSEYYLPLNNEHTAPELTILRSKISAGMQDSEWVDEIIDIYMHKLQLTSDWVVDSDKIIAEWELVEDLGSHYVAFESMELGSEDTVGYLNVYYYKPLKCFAVIKTNSDGEHIVRFWVPYSVSDTGIFHAIVQAGYCIYEEEEDNDKPLFGMLIVTRHGYDIRYVNVRDIDLDLESNYGSGFKEISDKIVNYTSDADKNGLIILHGVPGTGKTSFLRWLSGKAKRKFVYIPTEIVGQLSSTEFASFLMDNTGLTFIVEDAESVLMSREDGQTNSQVASILNMTDGIQGDIFNSQFICTFNTNLDLIDSALLRPGRLLVEHEFKELSVEDSNILLAKLGKDKTVVVPTTLANLMN